MLTDLLAWILLGWRVPPKVSTRMPFDACRSQELHKRAAIAKPAKIKQHHPDRGGAAAYFLVLQTAYREALAVLGVD